MPSPKGVLKPGSGRTKGAVSIVAVTLGDLKKYYRRDDQVIHVSRKFIEQLGVPYELLSSQKQPETKSEAKERRSAAPAINTKDFS